jgi:hypothetical protein
MSKSSDADARVPALQLLLGGADDKTMRALIYAAFPNTDLVLIEPGVLAASKALNKSSIRHTKAKINALERLCDFSSPIGRHGQEQIVRDLQDFQVLLTHLMNILYGE